MNVHRIMVPFAVAGLIAAAPFAYAQQAALPPVIKIGVSMALSGPGAVSGVLGRGVIDMTVREINAAGGIGGRKVEVVYADDASDPTRAVSEVKRLIEQERVHVVSGPGVAAPAMAAAGELTRSKIFSLPFTGATTITPQVYPYGFATFYPSDAFAKAMVDFATDVLKAKSIGVLTDTGAQGKSAGEAMRLHIPTKGAKLVGLEAADHSASDVLPQTLSLRRAGADVVLQVGSSQEGTARLYQATEQTGWSVPIVSQISSVLSQSVAAMIGSNPFVGGRLIGLTAKATTYCPGENTSQLPYVRFLTRLKTALPEWQKLPISVAGYYHDGIQIIKAASEGSNSVEGARMAAWLEENSGKVPTIMGRISASKSNHILYGADVFAFTKRPDQVNSDGLALREGC
jgi:branched-chain amino acid transport system substrate-binding protein